MSIKLANPVDERESAGQRRDTLRKSFVMSSLVFLVAAVVLFLGMPLDPNIYDEGIILTGAMRVAAGQVPHRDFYANYGPAQFYILAGLFRVFGESIFVERLFDLFARALLVACVYAIASMYCRRWIALGASGFTLLWLFALYHRTPGSAVIPVSLLNVISVGLVLPIFRGDVSRRRMLAIGALAGMAALFRYDTGIALLGIQACVIAIAICLRFKAGRVRRIASVFVPCLLGFVLVTLPAAIYYLSVAPYQAILRDIVVFPSKYYYRARNLPFPRISWKGFDNIEVYLLIVAIGLSFYAAVLSYWRARNDDGVGFRSRSDEQMWCGFFTTFGLLAMAMYFKGYVRISNVQLYLAIIPSVLILAGLFQRRFIFPRPARISVVLFIVLSLSSAVWGSFREALHTREDGSSIPGNIVSSIRGTTPEIRTTWCKVATPLTRGLCFLPDDDHIRVIEFINSHTMPDQRLFVGASRHDRIFANDNLIYFATQRLPATKWSHFDPDLTNRYDIQVEMVRDLETTRPPYIVLDSEYEQALEPNDSSKSSGVLLLDEYIHSRYRHLETLGEMSVWQRMTTP